MNNPLVIEEINEAGETVYKMASFDIEVIAKSMGGLAPTVIYMHGEKDVTDDIRALRFHYDNPATFIEDYPAFQSMLFQKEQHAINKLYDSISLKPKNMSPGKQLLWSFWVLLLVALPLIAAVIIFK